MPAMLQVCLPYKDGPLLPLSKFAANCPLVMEHVESLTVVDCGRILTDKLVKPCNFLALGDSIVSTNNVPLFHTPDPGRCPTGTITLFWTWDLTINVNQVGSGYGRNMQDLSK